MRHGSRARTLLVLSVLASVTVFGLISYFTTLTFGIKTLYVTTGLLIALFILEASGHEVPIPSSLPKFSPKHCQKIVLILAFLSFAILELFEAVTTVLLFVIPVAYALLACQYFQLSRITYSLLTQLTLLFFVTSYAKLASTYFYIGNLDLIKHTDYTVSLIKAGRTSAINADYAGFPILHIASGSISQITSINPHDSIILFGIFVFTTLIPCIYLFLESQLADSKAAFLSVLFVSTSNLYLFYSNYFFPQSLAMALFFLLLFVSSRSSPTYGVRFSVVGILIGTTMVFTHHFTFILVLPILVIFLMSRYMEGLSVYTGSHSQIVQHPFNWIGVGLSYIVAIYYWGDAGRSYLTGLVVISGDIISSLSGLGLTTGVGSRRIYLLGVNPVSQSIKNSIYWILSVNGIYNILLVALISIGFVSLIERDRQLWKIFPFALLTVFGSILILDTPLTIKSAQRLAFPLSIFIFALAGWGFRHLTADISGGNIIPVILLILVFSAVGPLLATNDVENHQGTVDPRQNVIEEGEYKQLLEASKFTENHHPESVSSFLLTAEMLRFFSGVPVEQPVIKNSTIESATPLIYSTNWHKYSSRYAGNTTYLNYVRFSESWLIDYADNRSKTYDAGQIEITSTDYRDNH